MNMRAKIITIFLLAVITAATSCSAKVTKDPKVLNSVAPTDTIMQNAVGDSIYRIITSAKKIEIASLPLASDSIKLKVKKKISSKDFGVINFIVTNPKNYMSNIPVYGMFLPQLQLKYTLKKEVVTLKYDFGLRKWGVFNVNNKEVGIFDLESDNMLRFACKQFPDNKFYHELLMTREPKK